ncbi:ABC transporter permease [Catenulispora yoronensis]|uniref:ABC transporter permease n=1 Tax=Catenulispora yoronensis TaxID=450799 RepID=A0ABP5H489_9ACTN
MLAPVARRLASALAVMTGAAAIAFAALQLVPGDPVQILLGQNNTASPEVRAQIRARFGLDESVPLQFLHYLDHLVHGDLGQSYQLQQPVSGLISAQLRPTAQLMAGAMTVAVVLAVSSALLTAGRRPVLRAAAGFCELVAVSAPSYWVGIVLLTVFSFQLHVFPVAGDQDFASLVLPSITLGLPIAGLLAQVLREAMEAALGQPFVLTARARGVGQTGVRLKHALRHAAIPLVTLTGWLAGSLLGGAVLVENIFGRPGIGALTLQAATNKDMPVVIALVLVSALFFVLISTVVDLLYLLIDPRLRTG